MTETSSNDARARADYSKAENSAQRGQAVNLVVAWFTLFVIGTDLFVVSPLLSSIAEATAVSVSEAGLLVTAFSVAYVVAAPFLGGVADRFGRRTVLVVGLVVFAAANLGTAGAPTLALMVIARVVAGMSAAAVTPSVYALVGQAASTERRGSWLAIASSGLLTSLWASVPAGSAASPVVGWRTIFVVLSVAAAVLVAANLAVWPGAPSRSPAPGPRQQAARALSVLTRIRAVSVTAFWAAGMYILYTYLGTGLRQHSFSDRAVNAVLIAYGVGAVLSSLFGGRLADRWGARKVSTLSLIGVAFVEVIIGVSLGSGVLLVGLLGLFALVGYATFPTHQSRLVAEFQQDSGAVLAWNNSALYVGISVGSVLGSAILLGYSFAVIPFVGAAIAAVGATASGRWAIGRAAPQSLSRHTAEENNVESV